MKLHYLQHVPFEDLANIAGWAQEKGAIISKTLLFKNEDFPQMSDFDWLVIMGGPMNIYQEQEHPWLIKEKRFIAEAINNNKIVLGICLGAQLIADILGGAVYKNNHQEIGWFPVSLTKETQKSPIFNSLPDRFIGFHWHGDTFDLPAGCIRIAASEGCSNQAFEYQGRVIGLQFHLESSTESIKQLVQNCGHEITGGKYVQSAKAILAQDSYLPELNKTMNLLLDNIYNKTYLTI